MLMNELVAEFRNAVYGARQGRSFIYRHRDVLHFVETHPETSLIIGLISCRPDGFLVNSAFYSTFLGLKQNSCNRNLQQHAFARDPGFDVEKELRIRFPGVKLSKQNWVKRRFAYGRFDGDMLDDETDVAANHARDVRQGRKPAAPPLPPRPNGEAHLPWDGGWWINGDVGSSDNDAMDWPI
jgi:hypothetical protein